MPHPPATASQRVGAHPPSRPRRATAFLTALVAATTLAVPAAAAAGGSSWPVATGDAQATARAQAVGPADPGLRWHTDLADVATGAAPAGYEVPRGTSRPILGPDGTIILVVDNQDKQYAQQADFAHEVIGLDPTDGRVRYEIPNASGALERCAPALDSQGRLWVLRVPPVGSGDRLAVQAFDPATGVTLPGVRYDIPTAGADQEPITTCNRTSIHIGGHGDDERLVLFGIGADAADVLALDISGVGAPSVAFRGVAGVDQTAGGPVGTATDAHERYAVFTGTTMVYAGRTGDGDTGSIELLHLALADGAELGRVELPRGEGVTSSGSYERVRMLITDDGTLVVSGRMRDATARGGVLAGIDLAGMHVSWTYRAPDGGQFDELTLGDGVVVVQAGHRAAHTAPDLLGVSLVDGSVVWRSARAGSRPISDLDGNLYTSALELDRFRRIASYGSAGEERWTIRPAAIARAVGVADHRDLGLADFSALQVGPVASDGTLYVMNGNLATGILALDDSGGLAEPRDPGGPGDPGPGGPRPGPVTFPDVPRHSVHAGNIAQMAARGITHGDASGNYRPSQPVNRAQIATFLARALELDPVVGQRFTDVPASNVHAGNINAVAAAGITAGVTSTTFDPNGRLTRAQLASLLARAFDLETAVSGPVPSVFTDVAAGDVHARNIDLAAAAGITRGVTDTTFAPRRTVARDQMASLLIRALDMDL